MRAKHVAFLCLMGLPVLGFADVRLPNVISDHAVLQRDRPVHIWGWATPGSRLQVHFHGQSAEAVADVLGKWSVWLQPESAGGPYELTVDGDGPQTRLRDLLVGDVWFASGQSNMEMPLSGFPESHAEVKDAAKEIAESNNPKLRLLLVDERGTDFPENDNAESWTTCTPKTAKNFSAVAYFFGREIAAKENVPVGLIDATWGGTPADSWMSMDALGTNPQLLPAFAARAQFANGQTDLEEIIVAEEKQDDAARAAGKPAPEHPWHPYEKSWQPAGLYNAMVAPFTPYTIKGIIWYQGETNSGHDRAPYYRTLFPALIADWRAHFGQGNLPFLYAQISSYNSLGEDWGEVRDAQRRTLSVANTAMAGTLDVGNKTNVHPPDKQTVAARLALAARAMVYGERVPYQSPLFRQATEELLPDGTIALRVWFDHGEGLHSNSGLAAGFEVAGEDRHYVPGQARLDGATVVISSAALAHPKYVRYAWPSYFDQNLYNSAGLPASTFSSDNSPLR
jgi:sialate O-acetylesterase